MKIIVAPDSFKGNLSSNEVALAIESGIHRLDSSIEVIKVPIADGGEGTVDALTNATEGRFIEICATGPLLQDVNSCYGISNNGKTAFIEMASVSGLSVLQKNEYNAMKASSYGTGELIIDALDKGCKKIIVGLGGSASNDGGAGALQALGLRLYDRYEFDLALGGGSLDNLYGFDISQLDARIKSTEFLLACDVINPLCGPTGASFIYGPQKGASPEEIITLDDNLRHFADVIKKETGKDVLNVPGAGAAGGMGAGLMAFLNAKIISGIDLMIQHAQVADKLVGADLLITAEGRMDAQTAFGKAPLGIAQLAQTHGIPVIGIAGALGEPLDDLYSQGFTSLFAIADRPMNLEESLIRADNLIEKLSENIIRLFLCRTC